MGGLGSPFYTCICHLVATCMPACRAERFSKKGADFGSQKWHIRSDQNRHDSAGRRTCVMQGVSIPLRSWIFFENVVLNEAIWCPSSHHVKHTTACLLQGVTFTLEQDGQKSGRAMPPIWEVEGPLAPLLPPSPHPHSPAYACQYFRSHLVYS